MSDLAIWHNPHCSKSREALRLVEERGLKPRIVRYLEEPPGAAEIGAVLEKLGLGPRAIIRTNEQAYRELGLDDPKLADAALIRALAENPILIERPIVIRGRKAIIARPPERALEILD